MKDNDYFDEPEDAWSPTPIVNNKMKMECWSLDDILSSHILGQYLKLRCIAHYLIQVWSIDDGLSGRILNQNMNLMILFLTLTFASE